MKKIVTSLLISTMVLSPVVQTTNVFAEGIQSTETQTTLDSTNEIYESETESQSFIDSQETVTTATTDSSSDQVSTSELLEETIEDSTSNSSENTELSENSQTQNLTQADLVKGYASFELLPLSETEELTELELKVLRPGYNVYTNPYNTEGMEFVNQLKKFYQKGDKIIVDQYAITSQNVKTYHVKGLGWVDHRAFGEEIVETIPINRVLRVVKDGYYLYNAPYNTKGAKRQGLVRSKYAKPAQVQVVNKLKTYQNVWVYQLSTGEYVDHRALDELGTITKEVVKNQDMRIKKGGYYLYSAPYTTLGSKRLMTVKDVEAKYGKSLTVTKEAWTSSGHHVYEITKNKTTLGWVDVDSLTKSATIKSQKTINVAMKIKNQSYNVYTEPFGTAKYDLKETLKQYVKRSGNQYVTATKEVQTSDGVTTYYLKGIGWVDHRSVEKERVISNEVSKRYMRMVKSNDYKIWKSPYLPGVKSVGTLATYKDKQLSIEREAVTTRGTYYQIAYKGKVIGWVNKTGLKTITNYVVPTTFYSQMNPYGAYNGCAVTSLYTALDAQSSTNGKSFKYVLDNLPLHSSNPNLGQVGGGAFYPGNIKKVISPVGLSNYAKRFTPDVANTTGKSAAYLANEIKKGHSVLFWGRARLFDLNSPNGTVMHVMTIIGYKPGYFLVQDPVYNGVWANLTQRWIPEKTFTKYYNTKGKQSMVLW
ncbi:GW domain-containing glycosaminoglycan-binding protein [Vagococcus zengguangii]|uniref:GW domain-containing glycosaminoglycan-binding protein n=1 Tax=Vagococcus zengguangii TaxID=2571750 RepID=UPI0011095B86|nr:GW domain-containing glycosaminoglycan-binding protein [Vagococcus zengguangii]TLG80921.1 GW domain-containing glycosaminoglycan-binding protein [Vagococcus zengguangii]